MPTLKLDLEAELRDRLAGRHVISTVPLFGDLLWDADGLLEEYIAMPAAVVIDAVQGPQRVVVQRVRGELRYWITTNRDPARTDSANELGVLATVEHLVGLCDEFLGHAVLPAGLKTPRRSGGIERGEGAP